MRDSSWQRRRNLGRTTINNASASNANVAGQLICNAGIAANQLWFKQTGGDLEIDLIGTSSEVTVAGWFAEPTAQLQQISAGGLKLDSQVSQLVHAIATYSGSHSGSDPTAAGLSSVPNDANLQNAMAAAWHS
jgi:hypothetical protein